MLLKSNEATKCLHPSSFVPPPRAPSPGQAAAAAAAGKAERREPACGRGGGRGRGDGYAALPIGARQTRIVATILFQLLTIRQLSSSQKGS